eukprot:sb/3477080/
MTAQLHLTTFLARPSLSILHRPVHSPSFLASSILIRLMLCSLQRASTSLGMFFSSVLSARTHRSASRLSSFLQLSRRPLVTPSAMVAFLRTSLRASIRLMVPSPTDIMLIP